MCQGSIFFSVAAQDIYNYAWVYREDEKLLARVWLSFPEGPEVPREKMARVLIIFIFPADLCIILFLTHHCFTQGPIYLAQGPIYVLLDVR